eukprot:1149077-Alexandrium_andersonii.AAC.1
MAGSSVRTVTPRSSPGGQGERPALALGILASTPTRPPGAALRSSPPRTPRVLPLLPHAANQR